LGAINDSNNDVNFSWKENDGRAFSYSNITKSTTNPMAIVTRQALLMVGNCAPYKMPKITVTTLAKMKKNVRVGLTL
jgi:hypothetical protein